MSLHKQDLINLPVETRSRQALGRVCDFELNPLTQQIERYYIKTGRHLTSPFPKALIIHNSQVLSITPEKMVVDDNVRTKPALVNKALSRGQAVPVAGA